MYFGYEENGFEGEGPNLFLVAAYSNNDWGIQGLAEAHPDVIYFEAEVVMS